MKIFSLLFVCGLMAAAAGARAEGFIAQKFDSYTLSLSWEPTFCEGKTALPECKSQTSDRFDATHLALHGLWPDKDADSRHDYGFCGVDPATQALDRAPTWCKMPLPPLLDATRATLARAMPGVESCLEHHEWNKHGTCSGMAADDYFTLAAALTDQVAATSFGRFLAKNVGETVTLDDAQNAFEKDFGVGSSNLIALNCAEVGGESTLLEVRLHLSPSIQPGAALEPSLIPTGDTGNCPSEFRIEAFQLR